MKIARTAFEAVFVLGMWLLLIAGIATENWWLFAPAAFLLIYERIGDDA